MGRDLPDPFCHYSINPSNKYPQTKSWQSDVTADKAPDYVTVIKQADIAWSGNEEACRKVFARIVPRHLFKADSHLFRADVFRLDLVGVAQKPGGDDGLWKRVGLAPLFEFGRWFLKPQTSAYFLLTYPTQATQGVTASDVRSLSMGNIFSTAGSTFGLGTIAAFKLKGGEIIRGFVYNFGFAPRWGIVKEESDKPGIAKRLEFPRKNVNVYFLSDSGKFIPPIDLSDIEAIVPLAPEDVGKLEAVFAKSNRSISEIQGELAKSDDGAEDIVL